MLLLLFASLTATYSLRFGVGTSLPADTPFLPFFFPPTPVSDFGLGDVKETLEPEATTDASAQSRSNGALDALSRNASMSRTREE